MISGIHIVEPGPAGTLRDSYGNIVHPPIGWAFLEAGDAGITRKVTAGGNYWKVQFKKGRRTISKGIWAPASSIENAKALVEATRSSESYKKKMASAKALREKKQSIYESEFIEAVRSFLSFHSDYKSIEHEMAKQITDHAVPVGSGTVARTTLIPLEKRAEKAVIAWMRHRTTAYDSMTISRQKGLRREIRRELAEKSRQLLQSYRKGYAAPKDCPLMNVLKKGV